MKRHTFAQGDGVSPKNITAGKQLSVAIGGFGMSGVAELAQVVEWAKTNPGYEQINIHTIDKKDLSGRGLPYKCAENKPDYIHQAFETLTMNYPNGLLLDHRAHKHGFNLLDWLAVNPPSQATPKDFITRKMFGDFLADATRRNLKDQIQSMPGVQLFEHLAEATITDAYDNGVMIGLENNGSVVGMLEIDYLFPCIGSQRSIDPTRLSGRPGYYKTAFNLPDASGFLQSDGEDVAMLVYGGISSCLDGINMLRKCGYQGEITVICAAPDAEKLRNIPNVTVERGYVDAENIQYIGDDENFLVPMTKISATGGRYRNFFTTKMILNADLWSQDPMNTISSAEKQRHAGASAEVNFSSSLLQDMYARGLVSHEDGKLVSQHERIIPIGPGLVSVPEGIAEDKSQWSLRACWWSAEEGFKQMLTSLSNRASISRLTHAVVTPSTHPTGLLLS